VKGGLSIDIVWKVMKSRHPKAVVALA